MNWRAPLASSTLSSHRLRQIARSLLKVECTTLDAYAEATGLWPGFLKIDVEGHELEVLRGATRILTSGPELLIEIHSEQLGEDIKDLLADDFLIEVVRHPHYPAGSELWLTHHWLRCFPFRN